MNFIAEFGFDVKKGRAQDFQRWMSENESKLAAACPSGVEYVGTYAVMYSSEKHSGSFRQFFRMESYGSQDTFSAAMKEGGAFANLVEEMTEFVDQERRDLRCGRREPETGQEQGDGGAAIQRRGECQPQRRRLHHGVVQRRVRGFDVVG